MMLNVIAIVLLIFPQDAPRRSVQEAYSNGTRAEYEVLAASHEPEVRDGTFTLFHGNGKKLVVGKYADGLRHGSWRFWTPEGNALASGRFAGGKRSGKWTFLNADKLKVGVGTYANGLPKGKWTFLDAEGKLDRLNSGEYGVVTDTYPDGVLHYSLTTLDQARHGPAKYFWGNGSIQLEAGFQRGQRCGSWRFWHSDGTPDPKLHYGEYAPAPFPSGFFEDPVPVNDGRVGEVPVANDNLPAMQPLNPGGLQSIPLEPSSEQIRGAYSTFLMGDGESLESAKHEIIDGARQSLPLLLEELRQLDYLQTNSLNLANRIVQELVEPILGGHPLIQTEAQRSPGQIKLSVLRAHSLFHWTEHNPAWWLFDLEDEVHGEEAGLCTLFDPGLYCLAGDGPRVLNGPYGARFQQPRRLSSIGGNGTQPALSKALDWLSRNQRPDGSWASADGRHDVGITGLALLALLGDGNTLDQGVHQSAVVRATSYLLGVQDAASGAFLRRFLSKVAGAEEAALYADERFLYDHAIATEAMSELAYLAPGRKLRRQTRAALKFIEGTRNPYGAWRYSAPGNGQDDTSVTGWMVSALAAGQRAGLTNDKNACADALEWFNDVTDPLTGHVGYSAMRSPSSRYENINADFPRDRTEGMTATALWCRFLMGADPEETRIADAKVMDLAADLMAKKLPNWDDVNGYSIDMCYWYFGTYSMRALGDKRWKRWNAAVKNEIVKAQITKGSHEGSWDPIGAWGRWAGRSYSTALMALCLEVYYRYQP